MNAFDSLSGTFHFGFVDLRKKSSSDSLWKRKAIRASVVLSSCFPLFVLSKKKWLTASERTRKLSPGVSAPTQTRSSQNAAFKLSVIVFLPPAARLPSPATSTFSSPPPKVRGRRLVGLKSWRRHRFLATKPLIKICGCCFASECNVCVCPFQSHLLASHSN